MEDGEDRNRLEEIEEKRKVLKEGEKEFREGERILDDEEKRLREKIKAEEGIRKDEGRWNSLFGDPSKGRTTTYALYALAVIIIFVLAIYLRTTLTKYPGFYEPDDFFHFSVIRAAVNNNFFIPLKLSLSGWPQHVDVTEPRGLYWVTLMPYFFLRFLGISYYTVERYIAVVYGLLDIIGAYVLARFISKDKFFLLLVIALVALSAGDAARTSALIYRGDGFVTIFLLGALIFMLYMFSTKSDRDSSRSMSPIGILKGMLGSESGKRKALFAALSGISLSLANFVWNGAPFVTLIYIGSLLLVLIVSFINERKEWLHDSIYVILSLLVWFIMVRLYIWGGQIYNGAQVLTNPSFLIVLALLFVGWYLAEQFTWKNYIGSKVGRLVLMVVVLIAGVTVLSVADPHLVSNIIINNGVIVTSPFAATIQELTPPTYSFLFASFGYALYTSPMAIIMTLPAVLLHGIPATSLTRVYLSLVFWIIMFFGFIPYLFMRAYDSKGFLGGSARLRLGVEVSMLVLIVYFATTSFLQIYAIRFNSLVAVPLAIFGAYTIYWLTLFSRRFQATQLWGSIALFFVALVLVNSVLQGHTGLHVVVAFAMALLAAAGAYYFMKSTRRYEIAGYAIAIVLLITILSFDLLYSASVAPADSMVPACQHAPCPSPLYDALTWLKNNSAPSSVVLTLWPDGSVVEGVANRTSIMDSVGSQNSQKSYMFANWLFNSSSDPGFLTNATMIDRPNYIVARYVWMMGESVGIFQESGLNASTENSYAFAPLTNFNEYANASGTVIRFTNGQQGSAALNAVVQIRQNNSIISYINAGNGRISPFQYVAFADQNTGNYSIVRQTAFNSTNNQMLLMVYSKVRNPQLPINITGAFILAPGLMQSNLAKLLFFCGAAYCSLDNNATSLSLVYQNSDTRIFKVSYNSSS